MSNDTMNQQLLATGKAFPWHEVYAPDTAASIEFYTKALGMETDSMEMGDYGTYHMLKHNGSAVAGVVSTTGPQFEGVPPHWAVYLSVDDVDARIGKVVEHGGKLLVPAMDIPTVGRMALISDPQGASIWLFHPAPSA